VELNGSGKLDESSSIAATEAWDIQAAHPVLLQHTSLLLVELLLLGTVLGSCMFCNKCNDPQQPVLARTAASEHSSVTRVCPFLIIHVAARYTADLVYVCAHLQGGYLWRRHHGRSNRLLPLAAGCGRNSCGARGGGSSSIMYV
jgi:hypothetical protein